MSDIPRLNGIIRALESGKPAFTSFAKLDPSHLHVAAPANPPHVFSAFPLWEHAPYRY